VAGTFACSCAGSGGRCRAPWASLFPGRAARVVFNKRFRFPLLVDDYVPFRSPNHGFELLRLVARKKCEPVILLSNLLVLGHAHLDLLLAAGVAPFTRSALAEKFKDEMLARESRFGRPVEPWALARPRPGASCSRGKQKPRLSGAFSRLRGKDSNLDYLIQSYRPILMVSIDVPREDRDFQGSQGWAYEAGDVLLALVLRRAFATRLQLRPDRVPRVVARLPGQGDRGLASERERQ
jgi:hypothetical protein